MRFSLATNFDDALIEQVRGTPVAEIFGKLPQDATGGGRASYQIVGVNQRRVADHVKAARAAGIGFNYLLNASCTDNLEFTRKGQMEIRKLLDWIEQIGVESVTVSSPFLLRIVKERHPRLRVRVSVFAGVDHVRKAKMWEELGADCVMLDSILVNREFEVLRAVRKAVRCELQLLVSNNCLQSCALSPYHMNTLAHASQSGHHTGGFFIDWCLLKCTQMKLQEPANYLRSEWIRPEDLHHYESLGYDSFKITERGAPTAVLVARVKAYTARRYEGNLLDLVQPFGFKEVSQAYKRRGLLWRLRYLLRPFTVDLRRLWAMKKLAEERGMLGPQTGPPPVVVDNRKLDGFIDRFLTAGCKDVDCDTCRHCHRSADKAVAVNPEYKERCLTLYDQVLNDMHSGRMWGLNSTPVPDRQGARRLETSLLSTTNQ
jgi:collagenase-like PrtC family protease